MAQPGGEARAQNTYKTDCTDMRKLSSGGMRALESCQKNGCVARSRAAAGTFEMYAPILHTKFYKTCWWRVLCPTALRCSLAWPPGDLGVPEDRDGVLGGRGKELPVRAKLRREVQRAPGPALLQGDERYGLVYKQKLNMTLSLQPPLRCG